MVQNTTITSTHGVALVWPTPTMTVEPATTAATVQCAKCGGRAAEDQAALSWYPVTLFCGKTQRYCPACQESWTCGALRLKADEDAHGCEGRCSK